MVSVWTGLTALAILAQPTSAWTHLTAADGLPEGEVRVIHHGPGPATWFGVRDAALAVQEGDRWRSVTVEDGLVSNGIAALGVVADELWAVGFGGYSIRRSGGWEAFPRVGGRTTRVIFSISVAGDSIAWLGAVGFAARFDGRTWSHVDQSDGLPHAVVHQVLVDRAGTTWFACRRGLARQHGGRLDVMYPDVNFRSIVEDGEGRLWFGTGGDGIFVRTGTEWVRHFEGETVLPTLVDRRGHVWAQTEGDGVFRFDGTRWTRFTTADGLLSDVVFTITEAPDGKIWFGTDRGVSQYDPAHEPGS